MTEIEVNSPTQTDHTAALRAPEGVPSREPSTINGEAPNAHSLLAALIDIYDDAQNNAPEHRSYVPEAWPDVLKEARTFLAALAEPSPVGGEPVAWISVEDRLPPPFEEVLVHPRPTDYCCEAQQHKGVWKYAEYTQWGQESHPCTVTHWTPMPSPPRAQFASPSNPKEKP